MFDELRFRRKVRRIRKKKDEELRQVSKEFAEGQARGADKIELAIINQRQTELMRETEHEIRGSTTIS